MKLIKEYKYYQREKESICSKFAGRYVVIVGENIVGNFSTQREAIRFAMKDHALGSFFVKRVELNEVPAYVPRMQVK